MDGYNYVAIDQDGNQKKGIMSSDNPDAVRRDLISKNLSPLSVEKINNRFIFKIFKKGIGLKNTILMTRQLSALLSGGVPLDEALRAIADQSSNQKVKELSLVLSSKIKEGVSFKQSLKKFPETFDNLYVSLIAAGEESGELEEILENTGNYLEQRNKIQQSIVAALIYPLVLIFMALIIVGLLLVFVVPSIIDQFSNTDQALPVLTQGLISFSSFLTGTGPWLLVILVIFIVIITRYFGKEIFVSFFDKILLRLPLIKTFIINSNLTRFTSSLSILRSSNIPILHSINISSETLTNSELKTKLIKNLVKVGEGESLSASLASVKEVPPIVIQMVASGERSGNLEKMLVKTSSYLDQEFEQSTKLMMSFLEPLVVVIMGGIVAVIVAAILLPMMQMNNISLIS
jgi:general secretion pathway protein F